MSNASELSTQRLFERLMISVFAGESTLKPALALQEKISANARREGVLFDQVTELGARVEELESLVRDLAWLADAMQYDGICALHNDEITRGVAVLEQAKAILEAL